MSFEEIKEQALKLSSEDRQWLAQELWESLDEREIPPEEGAEWQRRLRDLESGKVTGLTLEETLAGVQRTLQQARERKNASVG